MAAIAKSSGAEWRLFPPPVKQAPLAVGDKVFVRTKSAKEVGKKGVVFAFEKVPGSPPGPADWAGEASQEVVARGCSGSGGGGGGNGDGDRTAVWREVKKQKKKKKAKKWEDTRAVVRIPPSDEGNSQVPFDCRVRPSRLVPIYDTPASSAAGSTGRLANRVGAPLLVLLTAETLPYRLLAASQIRPTDRVLEVGCSTGETTAVLVKYAPRGDVVAFDVGADMVQQTKERLKLAMSGGCGRTCARVRVSKIDPFMDPRGAVEAASSSIKPNGEGDPTADGPADTGKRGVDGGSRAVDAVFIDIGGNREVRGVARMIAFARTAFAKPPRLIVVKSQALVAELKAGQGGGSEPPPISGSAVGCQRQCGRIVEGDSWFRDLLARSTAAAAPSPRSESLEERCGESSDKHRTPKHFHPNRAPLRLSPKDGVTPICRYHNYHREGCKKGERCPYEHAVCHWCLRPGHVALVCDEPTEFSALG
eukprot:g1878.t1